MTGKQMMTFIDNVNEVFSLGLTVGTLKADAWVAKFNKIDFELANTMLSVYYSTKDNSSYQKEIGPHDLFSVYDIALSKVGTKFTDNCEYCDGVGMINVKRFVRGKNYVDYAYACLCSSGNNKLEKITKTLINDLEQIQRYPARFADVYVWEGCKRTDELVDPSIVKSIKTKTYSKEAIDRFRAKKIKEMESDKLDPHR